MRALWALGLASLLAAPAAAGPQARARGETVSSLDTYAISRGDMPAQLSGLPLPAAALTAGVPLADPSVQAPRSALSPYARDSGARAAVSPAEPDPDALRAFLRGLKTVRIGVPSAPGNGHQAVGATIAKRLRELGFKGDLQFAFDGNVRHKMDLTLPGYDPDGPTRQRLALLGGEAGPDRAFDCDPAPDLYLAAADGTRIGQDGKVTISVQPYLWGTSDIEVSKKHYRAPVSEKALMFEPPRPTDPAAFIAERMSGSRRLREKIAGLQALDRGLAGRDVLPAYGMSGDWAAMKRLLVALDKARRLSPAALPSGVVVPVFSHLSDSDIKGLRGGLPPKLRKRVSIVSVQEPAALEAALERLKPGGILVARVGGVSQDVFEYFYSRATLPGTAAGVNAQNMLRVMGKPFLVTHIYYEQGLEDVYAKLAQGDKDLLRDAVRALGDGEASLAPLTRFIVKSKDPASEVSLAFRLAQPTSLRHDKVALLVDRARMILEAPAPAPALATPAADPAPKTNAEAARPGWLKFFQSLRAIPLFRSAAAVD